MNWGLALIEVVSKGGELVGQYFANKKAVAEQAHTTKMQALGDEIGLATQHAKNANSTWRDEFVVLVVMSPFILTVFAPVIELVIFYEQFQKGDLIAAVQAGFDSLNKLPEWYAWGVGVCISASLGVRGYKARANAQAMNKARDALTPK